MNIEYVHASKFGHHRPLQVHRIHCGHGRRQVWLSAWSETERSSGFSATVSPKSCRRTDHEHRLPHRIGHQDLTAIAVMQLSEQGLIDLDAPAAEYLRTFRLTPAKGIPPPTVRHLLSHTAATAASMTAIGT